MPAPRLTTRHKSLAQLLRDARVERGLTQQAVADRMGVQQSMIAKIEGEERRIDVIEFLDLAAAIGVPPERILRGLK